MTTGLDPRVVASSGMSPLELSAGMARGFVEPRPLMPAINPGGVRQALEASILRALLKPPCVVSFSGGRDSSSVLALAVDLARREGLPLPVPVSLRFPEVASSQEADWQEEVVRFLGLISWQKVSLTDELDLIGPYAQRVMRACGLLWPFNSHFHLPVADFAPGGSMLTGFGGDELMASGWVWGREMAVLARETPPKVRDVVRILAASSPRRVRRSFLRRRMVFDGPPPRPWLTPPAQAAATDLMLEDMLEESMHWGRSVESWIGTRYRVLITQALNKVAAMGGATGEHPLAEPAFLATIAHERGRRGFFDRTRAVQYLVGDLLPPGLINRSSKASFGDAFWNIHSREFAQQWDGGGVDPALVQIDALQRMWKTPGDPDGRTKPLFQIAWLAANVT